jgi:hypothetical protein
MYTVRFYKGDYTERQRAANRDAAVAYVEHHFNSSSSPTAAYAVVITGANASQTSQNWGRWYAQAISREFSTPLGGDEGIKIGGYNGRGDANLRFTDMPAILLEPLFASNPAHAALIRSADGQKRLAQVLVDSIQRIFPRGGLIAFSVGHKYKTSNPDDRGAAVVGGGSEAEYAEKVLLKTQTILEGVAGVELSRRLKVVKGSQALLDEEIDADAELVWDPERAVLRIVE